VSVSYREYWDRHLDLDCARSFNVKVSVIGVGHVGLVTAACMAELGHTVIGVDADSMKIEALHAGRVPFFEPGLEELVGSGRDAGRLFFTGDPAESLCGAEVVFICVGTPRRADGSPNLSYVEAAASMVATHAEGPVVVAEKSTVPVRTGERIGCTPRRAAAGCTTTSSATPSSSRRAPPSRTRSGPTGSSSARTRSAATPSCGSCIPR
jgi:nucleotide sugar dehydrogenase